MWRLTRNIMSLTVKRTLPHIWDWALAFRAVMHPDSFVDVCYINCLLAYLTSLLTSVFLTLYLLHYLYIGPFHFQAVKAPKPHFRNLRVPGTGVLSPSPWGV